MLQTLLVNLKLHFREKSQLFWLFAFPIILATMFNGMFGNIAEVTNCARSMSSWSIMTIGAPPLARKR